MCEIQIKYCSLSVVQVHNHIECLSIFSLYADDAAVLSIFNVWSSVHHITIKENRTEKLFLFLFLSFFFHVARSLDLQYFWLFAHNGPVHTKWEHSELVNMYCTPSLRLLMPHSSAISKKQTTVVWTFDRLTYFYDSDYVRYLLEWETRLVILTERTSWEFIKTHISLNVCVYASVLKWVMGHWRVLCVCMSARVFVRMFWIRKPNRFSWGETVFLFFIVFIRCVSYSLSITAQAM